MPLYGGGKERPEQIWACRKSLMEMPGLEKAGVSLEGLPRNRSAYKSSKWTFWGTAHALKYI